MENTISSSSSSSAWSQDKLESPHRQRSLWLMTTLSESDKKMKAMMTLLEEADDSSVERGDVSNKRKPELMQMLEDFNRSYSAMAEQFDQLTTSYSRKKGLPSCNQNIEAGSLNDPKYDEASDSPSESVVEDPDVECNSVNFQFEYLNRLADELIPTEQCKMTKETETKVRDDENEIESTEFFPKKEETNMDGNELGQATIGEFVTGHELKFQHMKLMEESLRLQAELLKRNDEKRKNINNLQAQVERLRSENRTLRSGLRFSKTEVNSKQTSRLLSCNNFFKVGCARLNQ